MNTITTAPVAPLLERLFTEADGADPSKTPSVSDYWNSLTKEDRARLVRSRDDYAELYGRLKDVPLAVSRATGTLLYLLARSSHATSIVEFGTSFGLSTICLAAAVRDNGGGRVITSEFEPSKIVRAQRNLADAGLSDLVEFREGDALQTLSRDLPGTVDFLLLDGAKALYAEILERIEPRLRPGALIVADNADFCPAYLERMRSADSGYLSMPFDDDVELSIRLQGMAA